MKSRSVAVSEALSSRSVFGAPCWVSLATRDLTAAQKFYSAVLNWDWRVGKLGEQYRFASIEGVPVAGVSVVEGLPDGAFAWTPFFATADADETVARSQERGGTTAVGPISFPPGRAALLADRDGAVFGIWEGELVAGWEEWRRAAPAFVELHTRDALDAAIFYAEVLRWASETEGCCTVEYADETVVLRSRGDIVARIHSGAADSARDPTIRPRWQIHFTVADVQACAEAAEIHGGSILVEAGPAEAVLRDPDGARFVVNHGMAPRPGLRTD
ncbi:VOC family protein [Streptomyces sp. Da 82-17]|uniref:VOC family protein n=1 Tax=Streptomyces sp. Da 82-17 TaxID=3377116 RepID=UPI0038D3D5D5